MSNELNVDGMSLAPGVVETIVSITATEVEGVASVGFAGAANRNLRSAFGQKPSTAGIETTVDDDGRLFVSIHIEVFYGQVLPEVAARLRQAIADALLVQVGVEVSAIDIYVDGIQFS